MANKKRDLKSVQKVKDSKPAEGAEKVKNDKKPKEKKFKHKFRPKKELIHEKISLVKETELLKNAEKLYQEREYKFKLRVNNPKQSEKDMKWYKSMIENGTLKDKISALSMIIKQEPKLSLMYLEELLKKAKSKDRKQAFLAIDVLQELFTQHLLPDDRKLSSFKVLINEHKESEDGRSEPSSDKLIEMYYEHMLRANYIEYVDILDACTKDTLEHFRKMALTIIVDCLIERPEQEETLLTILLNKIGDKATDVSKHAVEATIRLLKRHNNMTPVVMGEIALILERVNVAAMHNYMLICNKILFFHDDIDHINNALKLYFGQFKKLINNKNEEHKNKVISIILSGINKIVKNVDPGTLEGIYAGVKDQLHMIFKLSHKSSFSVRVECLQLIFQFLKIDESLRDRFYRTLYKMLLSLNNCSAFKLDNLFSLLFKSIKADKCIERVQAFIKRLLQMSFINEVSFTAAVLLMINELFKRRKELRPLMLNKQTILESDDEEVFIDVDDGEDGSKKKKQKQREKDLKDKLKQVDKHDDESEDEQDPDKPFTNEYDPFKIEPKFANADKSMFWELHLLKSYYHPSIQMFAKSILDGEPIKYSSDPLQDFSMANFLDKIILKPAKSVEKLKSMQKKRNTNTEEIKKNVASVFDNTDNIENQNFETLKSKISSNYRTDEEFLYKHLLLKSKDDKVRQQRREARMKDKEEKYVVDPEERRIANLDKECVGFEMSDSGEGDDFFKGIEDVELGDDGEGEGDQMQEAEPAQDQVEELDDEGDFDDIPDEDADQPLDEEIDIGDEDDDSMADFKAASDSE